MGPKLYVVVGSHPCAAVEAALAQNSALKSPLDLHPRRVERGIELERGLDLLRANEHLQRQRPSAAGEVEV